MSDNLVHRTTAEGIASSRMLGTVLLIVGVCFLSCMIAVALVISGGNYTLAEMWLRIITC